MSHGMQYLHEHSLPNRVPIIHRDLKSSNILLTTKREDLTKNFEVSATIRMLDDAGVVFVVTVSLKPTDRSYRKAVPKFSALSHGALGQSVERPSKGPRSAQLSRCEFESRPRHMVVGKNPRSTICEANADISALFGH